MLCGERPFKGDSGGALVSAILRDPPPPLRARRPETPKDLERIVQRCLEKGTAQRYPSTGELAEAVRSCTDRYAKTSQRLTLRNPVVGAALVLLIAAGGVGTWLWFRAAGVRWVERVALPEITRLTEAGDLYEAYRLARQAQRYVPGDAELKKMLDRITLPISVVTEPAGADVHVKGYMRPEADWEVLGQTPLQGVRIPYALMRWRISKTGFETFEGAPMGAGPFTAFATGLRLDPEGTRPPGMVRVPGGSFARPEFPAVSLQDFWLDRYEVTNRQIKEFVEAGGYDARQYWSERFLDAQRELPWDEAMTRFRDPTGRPGPSTWELGTYIAGRELHPVGGVSWYEAAAYCKFAGGSLPTVYHWYAATAQDQISDILRVSNFGGDGPTAVGNRPGLGDYGTYDMAGNVKEWSWNASGERRYILGGAWSEPTYMFRLNPDARLPFERLATHGFRCARFPEPIEESLLDPIRALPQSSDKPVSDDVFNAYRRMYAYDPSELAAKVEGVDESSPLWRRETVSFQAAYGGERVVAHLFLPRDVAPPYQAVVWFPGNDAFFIPSSQSPASAYLFDFIPRIGRALIYPVYKGMYERRHAFSRTGNEWRDMVIMWSKDLGRTLDYLQTRQDMDRGKLAYYGFSLGSGVGPIFTALDGRFHASVLLAGGLMREAAPEIDAINFASRSRTPTLMINGRDDFLMPSDSAQGPLLRLLAAPTLDKRHAVLDGGHIPSDRREIIREVLEWLDRYLGPVARKPAVPRGSR
jgi:formylglycine-generating enzyme required for sulfatase activity